MNANHGTVDAGIRAALTALLLLIGCPGDPADDDVSGDDDLSADDDDATDDDDDVTEAPPGCLGDPGPAPGPGVCADEAPCRWDGNGDGAKFGYAITAGKDFDGDGLPDFAVGAKGYTEIDDEGRVMLYPSTVATEDDPPAPGVFVGPQPLAYAGFSVTLVDDMDGAANGLRGKGAEFICEPWELRPGVTLVRPMLGLSQAAVRAEADHLESLVDDDIWPLPKYRELLFVH